MKKNRMRRIKLIAKKNEAFTFAEVLISLLVLTGSVYILSGLSFRSGRKVMKSAQEVERIFFLKKELYNLYLNPPQKDKPQKITVENPSFEITAHKQEVDKKKSELKDFADKLDIVWAEGMWESGIGTHKLKMISFVPKERMKKEK